MRIGVYVDGYNLYYGGRATCGRGQPGWRWLDVRSLVEEVIRVQGSWSSPALSRIVYCTARVDGKTNPSAHADQDVYLKALVGTGSVDWIEYGNYVARTKTALLATDDPMTRAPRIQSSSWPVMVRDAGGTAVRDAQFMVKYLHLEEKGSDVNLASHLLLDAMSGRIEGAVVVSNDSDLAFPLSEVRKLVPLGLINPRQSGTAGALKGAKNDGVGGHWWWRLKASAFTSNQLSDPASTYVKPTRW